MSADACRVLLADDTADIRALMRMTLDLHEGFEVVGEAADGAEAVKLAGFHQPDLVLLDLAMPVMDGLQAIPRIRETAPGAKIIVFSGNNAPQMYKQALAEGADGYLEKGTAPDAIVGRLRAACRAPAETAGDSTNGAARPPAPLPTPPGAPPDREVLQALVHELLNPVQVVEGYAGMLEQRAGTLPEDRTRQMAQRIGAGARAARGLLRRVSEALRMEAGELVLDRAPVDVALLAQEAASGVGEADADHPISFGSATEPVLATVDADRVGQALCELIDNAVRHTPAGTPVSVAVAVRGDTVEVSVTDGGGGVPQERREAVFGRFVRGTAHAPGLGLGLYLARGIARAHGGDVVLDQPPEAGARFTLRLPLAG